MQLELHGLISNQHQTNPNKFMLKLNKNLFSIQKKTHKPGTVIHKSDGPNKAQSSQEIG